MLAGAEVDWTQIIVTAIATLPALVSAAFAWRVHRAVGTPSGDLIGDVVERTHDLSSADLAMTTAVHRQVTNGEPPPEPPRPRGAHTRREDTR